MWKRLVQKRMNCGHTLLIERDNAEGYPTEYWVQITDTEGNESMSTEIGRLSDLKSISETFLKAYERAKRK